MALEVVFGEVKSFVASKSYGFISYEGKEIYVSYKQLAGYFVEKGDKVSFSVLQTEKGPSAINVKVLRNPDEGFYFGYIKSFDPDMGIGSIICDAFAAHDIDFTSEDLPEPYAPKDAMVKFKFEQTELGGNARNIAFLGKEKYEFQELMMAAELCEEIGVSPDSPEAEYWLKFKGMGMGCKGKGGGKLGPKMKIKFPWSKGYDWNKPGNYVSLWPGFGPSWDFGSSWDWGSTGKDWGGFGKGWGKVIPPPQFTKAKGDGKSTGKSWGKAIKGDPDDMTCWNYIKGTCTRGDNCQFMHVGEIDGQFW